MPPEFWILDIHALSLLLIFLKIVFIGLDNVTEGVQVLDVVNALIDFLKFEGWVLLILD